MRQPSFRQAVRTGLFCGFWLGALLKVGDLRADQVEMINGDRYVGRVISLGSDTLVIQSEFLGNLKLPRARISSIAFESSPWRTGTNAVAIAPAPARTNKVAQLPRRALNNNAPDFSSTLRELTSNSNVIQKVQQQFLTGAGPEAQTKFNDLVGGLLSGRVGVNELRAEAKTTLDRAKSARQELGEEGGASLDSYLAILEGFLKETEPAADATNSPAKATVGNVKPQKPVLEE